MPEKQPQIFLSYSWANKDIADAIDSDFKAVGITFQRDVRDVAYTQSIKEFMQRIGKSDFVVMLISDEYIKSENCMYEVTELLNSHRFENNILPIVVSNTSIFSRKEQEKYYDYWLEKSDDSKRLFSKHQNEKTLEDNKKLQNIYNNIGLFFQKLSDLKSVKYEDLKTANYKPMLNKINLDETHVLEQVIKTSQIQSKKKQTPAFQSLLQDHADNQYVLFQKAYRASKNKQYKKSKECYEEFLEKYPLEIDAYNNLAVLLADHFSDYSKAKKYLERALKINPEAAFIHFNLANILQEIADYDRARIHYNRAIKINPQYIEAHKNLGSLLWTVLDDYKNARKHYEIAIELNPNDEMAKKNLANLIKNHLSK